MFQHGQDTEAPKTSPPPPENYLLTLKALESRLQVSLYNALIDWV